MTDEAAITVVAGAPSDEETAAIAAVFTMLALERAASGLALPDEERRSAWERTARPMRAPLPRGGGWQDR